MKKQQFGKTDLEVTQVAFGGIPIQRVSEEESTTIIQSIIEMGINFIDTAFGYGDSEEKIGKAIKKYSRGDVVLSSKSPARDKKTFNENLETSLRRLQTDYIDIYHLHNVSTEENMKKVFDTGGAYEALEDAIQAGKVRYPAFSAHNLDIGNKMLLTEKFAVTQIPFNFIDNSALDEIIPNARKLKIGFISMKPLGGGLLDNARICFRYLKQFPDLIPDPGIEKVEEMKEIIEIMNDPTPLTEEDKAELERIKSEMGDQWCHRCEYCQPCPEEIPISLMLNLYSVIKRMPYKKVMDFMSANVDKARNCTECRACAERCPYELDIPNLLKQRIASFEKYKETGVWS